MTTTEAPRPGRPRTSGMHDLRLYLLALLALAYLVAWGAFGTRPGRAALETSPQPRQAIWYEDLPPAERPTIQLPRGWRLAARSAASGPVVREAGPVPVRVAPGRPGRIRTRSS
jgi:hypothetical protein